MIKNFILLIIVIITASLSFYLFLQLKTPILPENKKHSSNEVEIPKISKEEPKFIESIPKWVSNKTIQQNPLFASTNDVTSQVTFLATGDNLYHASVIADGEQIGKRSYEYIYEEIRPAIQSVDIAMVNQETPIGGNQLGVSGYPIFNTPEEVGDALVDTGFDVVTHATNHALDYKEKGVFGSIRYWKKQKNITMVGLNETKKQQDTITYVQKNDITFAFLNYTFSTNGIVVPGKEYLVNRIEKAMIKKHVEAARKKSDILIVAIHWGTEYEVKKNSSQKELAQFLANLNVDLVIGNHPHILQPVEWLKNQKDTKHNTLVYYSLGNFVSSQEVLEGMVGGLAYVNFVRLSDGSILIKDAAITPIVTHYQLGKKSFKIFLLTNYKEELALKHGISKFIGLKTLKDFQNIAKWSLKNWYIE